MLPFPAFPSLISSLTHALSHRMPSLTRATMTRLPSCSSGHPATTRETSCLRKSSYSCARYTNTNKMLLLLLLSSHARCLFSLTTTMDWTVERSFKSLTSTSRESSPRLFQSKLLLLLPDAVRRKQTVSQSGRQGKARTLPANNRWASTVADPSAIIAVFVNAFICRTQTDM